MKFTVMNRNEAIKYSFKALAHNKRIGIVSISNIEDPKPCLARGENIHTCHFFFDDVEEGPRSMSQRDAAKIFHFVNVLIKKNIVDEIVVHCSAGVSRSAGVCAALMKIFNDDDMEIFDSIKYSPNMDCYRKVLNYFYETQEAENPAEFGL